MDVTIINPVISSVVNILSTMAQLDTVAGRPKLKTRNETVNGKHITGLISMTGETARASIALTFSEETILYIAQKMLSIESKEIDSMVMDLAGELANMALGGAKSILEQQNLLFNLSLPTIIIGNEYLIAHPTKSPIIQLPFRVSVGDFFLEASYENLK